MKILLVNDYTLPTYGAENQVLALRRGLLDRGHDARIFSSWIHPEDRRKSLADYHFRGTRSHLQTLVKVANPWAFRKLRQVLAKFRPQVVHVRMFLPQLSPLILPLLKNIPALYLVAAHTPVCPMGNKLLPDQTLCRQLAGATCYRRGCLPLRSWPPQMIALKLFQRWKGAFDVIVANSRALQRQLARGGLRTDAVLWNFVPYRKQRPPLCVPPTAVFAGHLIPEKGAHVLIRAFKNVRRVLPDARLVIAGDGPRRASLEHLISRLELGPAVHVTGHLSRSRMEALFDRAWLQVVPGLLEEPFGNVAAEAMMRGTAVIASNLGGPAEYIQDAETGFLVEPGNVHALSRKILVVLSNREIAEKMGRRGRAYALKNFSQAHYIDTLLGFYRKARQQNRGN